MRTGWPIYTLQSIHCMCRMLCVVSTCEARTGDRLNTLNSFYLHSQRPLLLIIRRTDERLINKFHR
jgi:hypothetical protein